MPMGNIRQYFLYHEGVNNVTLHMVASTFGSGFLLLSNMLLSALVGCDGVGEWVLERQRLESSKAIF